MSVICHECHPGELHILRYFDENGIEWHVVVAGIGEYDLGAPMRSREVFLVLGGFFLTGMEELGEFSTRGGEELPSLPIEPGRPFRISVKEGFVTFHMCLGDPSEDELSEFT